MSSNKVNGGKSDLSKAAEQAYLYTVPLIQTETTRKWRSVKGANIFSHSRILQDHRSRVVTTPNTDTLYSSAWLDLSHGPVTVTVPETGERYFSLAFMDMYSNNFSILGTRTTGGHGGVYTLIGPDQPSPASANKVLRAPTNRVWALARILIDGPEDLDDACAIQDGLAINEDASRESIDTSEPVLRSAPWDQYFRAVNALLKRERPPITDGRMLDLISPLGIGPDQTFDAARFSPSQIEEIKAGMAAAKAHIEQGEAFSGITVDGWSYPDARLGNFGEDYVFRAVVSVGALAALPLQEAIYMRAIGELEGGLFDGGETYRLHFPEEQMPPLDSFWSLTLYEPTKDGQFFFFDNPLRRYAIGDRTAGLIWNDDGSLDIDISAEEPAATHRPNWLPAPEGRFMLLFRGYMPRKALLSGEYRLPRVKKI